MMAASNMHNLTTLIKRLEAATSRLEDMAEATFDRSSATGGLLSGISTPGISTGAGGTSSPPAPPKPVAEPLPVAIEDFDELISKEVKAFVQKGEELGGLLAEQAKLCSKAFSAERTVLVVTTKAKKPDITSPVYMEILTELQTAMGAVADVRETNRASPLFNHLSMVSEGIQVLSWITIEPKPADYVTESLAGAQYYGNRVLKEYKEKEPSHTQYVQAFYQIFRSLAEYVKKHYAMGVTWNNKDGVDAKEALKQVHSGNISTSVPGAPPAAAGGPPPPPPPPPPLPNFENLPPPPSNAASKGGAGDMDAVFQQLNQGEAVTKGLRKVDKAEMTHKNPSLRASSVVPRSKSPAPPGKKPKPESMRTKKPPRKELDGNKWIIENFDNESSPIEIEASINHSVLISRCSQTTIRIIDKANAISADNSPKLALIIDSLVSSVDVIKSPGFALQVLGTLPTVMLDQVDGATVYLSKDSLNTEIFTSKCSAVNINIIEGEDGDYKECAVPEQIKTVIKGGNVVNEIVEHAG